MSNVRRGNSSVLIHPLTAVSPGDVAAAKTHAVGMTTLLPSPSVSAVSSYISRGFIQTSSYGGGGGNQSHYFFSSQEG